MMTVKDVLSSVDTAALVARPLTDWRPILANEVNVFVSGENYLAKRFDQINFKFCEKNEAKEILIDNLYALLRYKYFPKMSEEIDDRINKIVSSFTSNLKTTLKKVTFEEGNSNTVKFLPDYCIAFRNGVFNFKDNKWFFKYDIVKIENLANTIYMYDNTYIITWYFDYNFESLDFDIKTTSLEDFIKIMKDFTKTDRNYCFELMYNISHDDEHKFDINRFKHLCEILGYTVLQSFTQYFVMLIGSGGNGKNSLFDGCFTSKVIPRPASNGLDEIETDKFITGALENKAQNIYLETEAKTFTQSKTIKALTGSMYQTIESKGINKYSSIINCKYIFAGNNQDEIKFSDNTSGFRRRINMYEIFYQWDADKRFMKKGDYYDTTFSHDLREIKNNIINTTTFIYFAMYGIMTATKCFKDNFKFNKNDWNNKYLSVDIELKDVVNELTLDKIVTFLNTQKGFEIGKTMFYDDNKSPLKSSSTLKELGYNNYEDMIKMLSNEGIRSSYFAEHDIYMSVRGLQSVLKDLSPSVQFTASLKKAFNIKQFKTLYANQPYFKCTFINNKLKIIKE